PQDDDTRLHRARVALALGRFAEAREEAQSAAAGLRKSERKGELWRAEALLARALAQTGQIEAAEQARARARATFEEIRMKTPESYRGGLPTDPDAALLALGAQAPSPAAESPARAPAVARLRRLIALNKRLNSELRLPRLLELVLDAVVEFTD